MKKTLIRASRLAICASLTASLGACCFFTPPYAYGGIAEADIRDDYPEFRQVYGKTPLATPLAVDEHTRFLVFFGTWCHDSIREVPRYMRLADASHFQTRYIALDKQKTDPDGIAKRWQITHTPTFVVVRDGREIGRIVERPKQNLHDDLARILAMTGHDAVGLDGKESPPHNTGPHTAEPTT